MRGWWLVIASITIIAVAYVGDGLLNGAVAQAGTRPSTGTTGLAVAVDLVFKLVIVAAAGLLAWLALHRPGTRGAGVAMLVSGLYASLLLGLSLLGPDVVALPGLFGAYGGAAHLTRWAGTAVVVIAVLAIVRPSLPRPDGSVAGWAAVAVALGLIGLGYVADTVSHAAFIGWSAEQETLPFVAADVLVRFATVAAILALAWLALGAHRGRVVGGVLLAIGLYLVVVLELGYLFWGEPPFAQPAPFSLRLLPQTGTVVEWLGIAFVVIGSAAIMSPAATRAGAEGQASIREPATG